MRRFLSKSEIKELNERLALLGIELSKKDEVELDCTLRNPVYKVNGEPWFFELSGLLVPHLKLLNSGIANSGALPRVTVDMGAVKFVVNGADIMRPGITAIEDGIDEGQLVAVVDQTHGKVLAVGKALLDTVGLRASSSGKAVKNLHWVGDGR